MTSSRNISCWINRRVGNSFFCHVDSETETGLWAGAPHQAGPRPRRPYPAPRTCEDVTLHGRKDFTDVVNVKGPEMRDSLGHPGQLSRTAGVLRSPETPPPEENQRGGSARKTRPTVAGFPGGKRLCVWPLGAKRGQEMDSLCSLRKGREPCRHPDFSRLRPVLKF